ncbi:MAG: hypothetical protein K8R69_09655 [Deltaproteobacteria bacterium]|nr:hypothetical protein [Deltaproteobacteria bacterium]
MPRIELDPDQLLQVLSNLLRNAFQAMPDGGRLTLELAQVNDQGRVLPWLSVGVSDTGAGMDEETQSRLFEPFFSKREDGSGTGLGLSIVYGIVQEHGGKIFVTSRAGEGTRFDIYLPMEPEMRTHFEPKTITYYSEKEHA